MPPGAAFGVGRLGLEYLSVGQSDKAALFAIVTKIGACERRSAVVGFSFVWIEIEGCASQPIIAEACNPRPLPRLSRAELESATFKAARSAIGDQHSRPEYEVPGTAREIHRKPCRRRYAIAKIPLFERHSAGVAGIVGIDTPKVLDKTVEA